MAQLDTWHLDVQLCGLNEPFGDIPIQHYHPQISPNHIVCLFLSWHTFIHMQFQMFVYFLPFEGYFNYICVFNLVYWSGIDLFHIYYLPTLLIRKKNMCEACSFKAWSPQKNPPKSTLDFGSRRFSLIVQRNPMQRTRSTAAQVIGEPLLMEDIPHRLISKHPSILQGFIHVRWCRTSSINRMIRFTQKIFSWNLSVIFVPSKTPPMDPNVDTQTEGLGIHNTQNYMISYVYIVTIRSL